MLIAISVFLLGACILVNSLTFWLVSPLIIGFYALCIYLYSFCIPHFFIDPKDINNPDAIYRHKNKLLEVRVSGIFTIFGIIPYSTKQKERKLRWVVAHNPNNAHAHFLLGKKLIEAGNTAEGNKEIETARSLKPDFPDYQVDVTSKSEGS